MMICTVVRHQESNIESAHFSAGAKIGGGGDLADITENPRGGGRADDDHRRGRQTAADRRGFSTDNGNF